jgi:uncharacterized protein with ATP-grasp and redox domains
MDLNINVDSAAINKYMAEKVLESTLGDQIKRTIAERMKDFDSYNSPLKGVVDQYIREAVSEHLRATYGEQIKEKVKAALAGDKLDELVKSFVGNVSFKSGY